ncbi:MAG: S1 family peptidase, partial [Actinomycetota bacterium]|nr:S1 family peptidase [Actinomycetota bacterium]
MSRRLLVLALVAAIAALGLTTPARAGLLSPLLGGSDGTEADWTLGGQPCRLVEMPTAGPLGVTSCPGVRPGSVIDAGAGLCSLNFMFTDPTGQRYMGTAGHCLLATSPFPSDGGEVTFAPGQGPAARDIAGERIGEFAYAIQQDPKDFALV